jgi:hypothetical protein
MEMYYVEREYTPTSGVDPEFKVRGAYLKKLRRAEGGAKIFGVFRVKDHDFTPENHIFSNCGGRRENCWGISCEKSRLYAKKSYFFPIAEAGAKIFGVFRVKNHDFTPKNHIFFQLRRQARKYLGYFV